MNSDQLERYASLLVEVAMGLREGQEVVTGQRVGIIRFGSRVDVYCPPPYVTMVVAGQRMVGGETVLVCEGHMEL